MNTEGLEERLGLVNGNAKTLEEMKILDENYKIERHRLETIIKKLDPTIFDGNNLDVDKLNRLYIFFNENREWFLVDLKSDEEAKRLNSWLGQIGVYSHVSMNHGRLRNGDDDILVSDEEMVAINDFYEQGKYENFYELNDDKIEMIKTNVAFLKFHKRLNNLYKENKKSYSNNPRIIKTTRATCCHGNKKNSGEKEEWKAPKKVIPPDTMIYAPSTEIKFCNEQPQDITRMSRAPIHNDVIFQSFGILNQPVSETPECNFCDLSKKPIDEKAIAYVAYYKMSTHNKGEDSSIVHSFIIESPDEIDTRLIENNKLGFTKAFEISDESVLPIARKTLNNRIFESESQFITIYSQFLNYIENEKTIKEHNDLYDAIIDFINANYEKSEPTDETNSTNVFGDLKIHLKNSNMLKRGGNESVIGSLLVKALKHLNVSRRIVNPHLFHDTYQFGDFVNYNLKHKDGVQIENKRANSESDDEFANRMDNYISKIEQERREDLKNIFNNMNSE